MLDIASKIFSNILVARLQKAQETLGLEAQCGFRGKRGTIDGLWNLAMALQKRKEHGLETWALFIDLVKAFDTVMMSGFMPACSNANIVPVRPNPVNISSKTSSNP